MASIVDLCWTHSEELFRDLDLDALYLRQTSVIGRDRRSGYPYLLLLHTGKITIGISLGNTGDSVDEQARLLVDDLGCQHDEVTLWNLFGESSD
jgi:hypothetical protein